MAKKAIEFGKSSPRSSFDRRPKVGTASYKAGRKGKGSTGGNAATQSKKHKSPGRGQ